MRSWGFWLHFIDSPSKLVNLVDLVELAQWISQPIFIMKPPILKSWAATARGLHKTRHSNSHIHHSLAILISIELVQWQILLLLPPSPKSFKIGLLMSKGQIRSKFKLSFASWTKTISFTYHMLTLPASTTTPSHRSRRGSYFNMMCQESLGEGPNMKEVNMTPQVMLSMISINFNYPHSPIIC